MIPFRGNMDFFQDNRKTLEHIEKNEKKDTIKNVQEFKKTKNHPDAKLVISKFGLSICSYVGYLYYGRCY